MPAKQRTTGNPYNAADHRAHVAELKRNPKPCWHAGTNRGCRACREGRCAGMAEHIDHVPPLMNHQHVAWSGCCRSLPACTACNCSTGASEGNRRRVEPQSETW